MGACARRIIHHMKGEVKKGTRRRARVAPPSRSESHACPAPRLGLCLGQRRQRTLFSESLPNSRCFTASMAQSRLLAALLPCKLKYSTAPSFSNGGRLGERGGSNLRSRREPYRCPTITGTASLSFRRHVFEHFPPREATLSSCRSTTVKHRARACQNRFSSCASLPGNMTSFFSIRYATSPCAHSQTVLICIPQAGFLAQKRLARGLRLNQTEAVALIASQLQERIRDGTNSVADLMQHGKTLLGRRQVLPGVATLIQEIQVEGTFKDGQVPVLLQTAMIAHVSPESFSSPCTTPSARRKAISQLPCMAPFYLSHQTSSSDRSVKMSSV